MRKMFKNAVAFFLLSGCFGPFGKTSKDAEPALDQDKASQPIEIKLPSGLSYERRTSNQHVVHILSVDPQYFRVELVKAHHQVFGRETVPAIAQRMGAIAAINGGFFEIGQNEDGRPSGTLMIDGRIFSWAKGARSLLALGEQNTHIGQAETKIEVKINGISFGPDKVNRFVKRKDEIILYNDAWGSHSLTPYERREVLIDHHLKVIDVVAHGDNPIPRGGWLLSFPKQKEPPVAPGQSVFVDARCNDKATQTNDNWRDAKNIIMGIPALVSNGHAVANLEKAGSASFAAKPQARTAVGIRTDGTLVFVVVEHVYSQSLRQVTLAQVADILRKEGYSQLRLAVMTVPQIRSIVEDHLSPKSANIGLNLPELAELMVDLGCHDAINMDGGGSSTMFLDGHVVNTVIGDKDEGMGQEVLRPVSDAIVILKRD